MDAVEYDKMFAVEDRHFWFRGRRAWLAALLHRHVGSSAIGRVLDVGCGTGGNLAFLAQWGEVFGVDQEPAALAYCTRRGFGRQVTAGSANDLPFPDGRFALACALDVLYHRGVDPQRCLAGIRRVLKPHGYLLVSDPAMPFLAGPHDRAVGGRERYTRESMRALVEGAGFEVLQLGYANCLLFPLVLALRMLERRRGATESSVGTRLPVGNDVMYGALRLEAALLARGLPLPFGSSVLCLARRGEG